MLSKICLVWVVLAGACGVVEAAVEWTAVKAPAESGYAGIAIDPHGGGGLLVVSDRRVYRSVDGGLRWKQVAAIRGADAFRTVAYAPKRGHALALSEKTLYLSDDGGVRWRRWRKLAGPRRMLSAEYVDESTERLWIGTDSGLYLFDPVGESAEPVAELPETPVLGLGRSGQGECLAVTPKGIYRYRQGRWSMEQPISRKQPESTSGDALGQFAIEELAVSPVNAVIAHSPRTGRSLVTGPTGLWARNAGKTWEPIGGEPVSSGARAVQSLSDGSWIVASESGVYRSYPDVTAWVESGQGLAGAHVRGLGYDKFTDTIYAATDRGLYRARWMSVLPGPSGRPEPEGVAEPGPRAASQTVATRELAGPLLTEVLGRYAHEPSVRQVQEQAVRYAEVHPEKIAAWRRAAARKAWLPSVTVGWDLGVDQTVDLDRGGTGDPDRFIIGPEESDTGWSVNIGWDLGDLIWNDDQTSIDTRSKLMVELREDVLNEVTHVYFERRRLQVESALVPGRETGVRLERELKIQELTARLDAWTDGWFSERLKDAGPREGGASALR
ncbi:MAG: hypothetical protein MOGMAGMI_01336 [Candidatus Omnitrophica bacterium]|nr:hypothetical protein [Candidatus Omnitrophota bacterium]